MALHFACLRKICCNDEYICADDSLFSWCLSRSFLFFYYFFFPNRNSSILKVFAVIFFTFEQPEVSIFTLFGSNSLLFLQNIWVICMQSFGIKAQKRKSEKLNNESHFLPCNTFSFPPTHFFKPKLMSQGRAPRMCLPAFYLKSLQRERDVQLYSGNKNRWVSSYPVVVLQSARNTLEYEGTTALIKRNHLRCYSSLTSQHSVAF